MDINDPVLPVIDALLALKIPFMLVGSYSSNAFGIPRSTKDADFVIELGEASINALASMLKPQFELDPQMGFETVTCHHRWLFRHRDSRFEVELFVLPSDQFDQERFSRRVQHEMCGRTVWIQSPEDVIVNKLRWGRTKDQLDAVDVMKVMAGSLDWSYIRRWCEVFGRTDLLEKQRKEAGLT